jgi:hypothetical protein
VTEWWTYGLSDFLMFSPATYWRLVARYNAACWPAQWLALGALAALPLLLRSPASAPLRIPLLLLAAAWGWVGVTFYWQWYAEIFLGAPWMAGACGLQALLLVAAAAWGPAKARRAGGPGPVGWLLLGSALLYPLLAPVTGHPWTEAEVFGLMPDPTALATMGTLVALRPWPMWTRCALAVIPLLAALLGAATRWLIAQ